MPKLVWFHSRLFWIKTSFEGHPNRYCSYPYLNFFVLQVVVWHLFWVGAGLFLDKIPVGLFLIAGSGYLPKYSPDPQPLSFLTVLAQVCRVLIVLVPCSGPKCGSAESRCSRTRRCPQLPAYLFSGMNQCWWSGSAWIRIDFSRLELDPQWECGSGSRMAKQTNKKKVKNFYVFVLDVLF